jgi:hypothetical protein
MIQRKADGITLFYVDAAGAEIAATPGQWQRYTVMLATQAAQTQAAIDDTQALANYHNQLSLYQTNLNDGRAAGLTPPLIPQHEVVDDATGVISYVPFVPALPIAVAPVIKLPDPTIASTNPPADRTDTILQMNLLILAAVNAIKAKVGA